MKINGIDIEVERKNIKHVHLSVYPSDGRVHVSAPADYSDRRIEMYVLQKWVWVEEKREAMRSYVYQGEREYVSGEEHYFLGGKYRLRVERRASGAYGVRTDGDYIVVSVHTGTAPQHVRATLYGWYKERLTPLIGRLVKKWEALLGVSLSVWEIRLMAARWGSCSKARREAYFNVELAKKPVDCIEYVVAHEMIHLIERNHTDRFRRLLDTYLPAWEELKNKLNEMPV